MELLQANYNEKVIVYIIYTAISFIVLSCTLFFAVLISRRIKDRHQWKVNSFKKRLQLLILTSLFSENETLIFKIREHFRKHYFKKRIYKEILLQEIFNMLNNISGETKEKLKALYFIFELDMLTRQKLRSGPWHIKGRAMEEVAAMGMTGEVTQLSSYLNSPNNFLSNKSLLTILKLKGKQGLLYIDKLNYSLSEYQQMCIIQVVTGFENYENLIDNNWYTNTNKNILLLNIKLIQSLNLYDGFEGLIKLLDHEETDIKVSAIKALGMLRVYSAKSILLDKITTQTEIVRLEIIKALRLLGDANDINVLIKLLPQASFDVSNAIQQTINVLKPEVLTEVLEEAW